jgi:hypothetical protein
MMYPTTVVGFVAPDGASPTIDGADGRQNSLYLCCSNSRQKLALSGSTGMSALTVANGGHADQE